MSDREPPVERKPGPPQGRIPKMMSRPSFIVALTLILAAVFVAGFFA